MFKNALHNNNAYINNRIILLNYIRNEYLKFFPFPFFNVIENN